MMAVLVVIAMWLWMAAADDGDYFDRRCDDYRSSGGSGHNGRRDNRRDYDRDRDKLIRGR